MEQEFQAIIPNTTQIPHLIIREWMPLLGDVELRVLLVVADQTLGWIENPDTGRRKEKDWISQGQLMKKINRSDRAIQNSLKRLVDELRIIQAHDEAGELLDSPKKRMRCGGKIFYRLSLKRPVKPAPELFSGAGISREEPPKNLRAKNLRVTKETVFTNKSYRTSELAVDNKKETLPTRYFFWKFKQLCRAIRHAESPLIKFKDGNLIKHALKHLTKFELEIEFIWFLQNKLDMEPTIGAALSREVISDFIKASHREYGFYGNLERTAMRYCSRQRLNIYNASAMVDALKKLRKSFCMSN